MNGPIDWSRRGRIVCMPEKSIVTASTVQQWAGEDAIACDFYIQAAEKGQEIPGGYRLEGLDNIDHHAPARRMQRFVSSTNLAIEYVAAYGLQEQRKVLMHHTDCDSVLSSCVVAGVLPPNAEYGAAAIAADHTGAKNSISDLLQSMEPDHDLDFSLRQLERLLLGQELEEAANERLKERMEQRLRSEQCVSDGRFKVLGPLAYGTIPARLDPTLLIALLPEAALIATFRPLEEHLRVRIRLGLSAPEGAGLHALGIEKFDTSYGGRWNAGSNRRGGGTDIPIEAYAAWLASRAAEVWNFKT